MSLVEDFSGYNPTWCPGCGNWGIGMALKTALANLNYSPSDILVSFGVGCSGNANDFLNAYGLHTLHGRSVSTIIGMKIANHKMPVIAVVGDGDCYGEGGNHLLHAVRGNHDVTVIVHNNSVYGLTTGQVAPTAQKGFKSKSTPFGIIEKPLNPLSLALTQGASFIGQSFAGNLPHMTEIIAKAIKHKGFSLVNVLQPCVTFNKIYTYPYFIQHSYKLDEKYDPKNYDQALVKTEEYVKEKFALGVIYQEERATYTDELSQLKNASLVEKDRFKDFSSIISEFI